MTERPVPRATYRLQLNKDFRFPDVAKLAPYLGKLGISHVYLSPVTKARAGSTHGYDTVDHSQLNPELGSRDDFTDMAAALRREDIGIILDIVPNHMGIGGAENDLWLDVLEHGQESRYAHWFDIDWNPAEPSLKGKVLAPFLGRSIGDALEKGALELRFDPADGSLAIWAEGTHKLPLAPSTYRLALGDAAGLGDLWSQGADADLKRELHLRAQDQGALEQISAAVAACNRQPGHDRLQRLIEQQHWRPARYSVAADDINYRRFFIVSDLAAIRIEEEEVFDEVHRLPFQLVEAGLVEGLRVDHIDGLYDPKAYCLRVREKCPRPIYLVVEKILAPHEALRLDWDVDGTTGYEFASAVTRLLADRAGEADLTDAYRAYTGHSATLAQIEHRAKLDIIDYEMAAELDALALRLRAVAKGRPATADLTRNALRNGLRHAVAAMPVYRSYVDAEGRSDQDRRNIAFAIAVARREAPAIEPAVFDFVGDVMAGELGGIDNHHLAEAALDTALRIQQYTGPVMAKGLEDTALYRYNRLLALSDVGEKPDRFGQSVPAFHSFNAGQMATFPHALLTSSSHDTKRGEDARARIVALSGRATDWAAAVDQWTSMLSEAGAPSIEANDRWYFFQLLLGSWPTEFPEVGELDPKPLETFRIRLDGAMLKSVREARVRTNWNVPKAGYEQELGKYVALALSPEAGNAFLASFRAFERSIGSAGAHNGLVGLVMKLTSPGVPDIYQGAEFWEQSMVDPDNRRAVDFAARSAALDERAPLETLLTGWRDGRIKQLVAARLLGLRRTRPVLFSEGSYTPMRVDAAEPVCAFLRETPDASLLVVARLDASRPAPWSPIHPDLPAALSGRTWVDVIADAQVPQRLDALLQRPFLPFTVAVTAD